MNAKIFGLFAENQETPGLAGGERRIRTPETLSHSMEGILPSLGHYAASKKSSRAEENLSTWIRLFFANLCGFLGSLCSRAELGDVERQTNVQSSNSHLQRRAGRILLCLFHCAHGLTLLRACAPLPAPAGCAASNRPRRAVPARLELHVKSIRRSFHAPRA